MTDLRQRFPIDASADYPSINKPAEGPSDISPAVPTSILLKLLTFVFLLVTAPLGVYFGTINTLFNGNSTWSAASAALTANVVLVGYLAIVIMDDKNDNGYDEKKNKTAAPKEGKKSQ
ncbi:hypothetical protein BT63DRAFT_452091 [Microthyrium microscopicum]|uniref:Vacuolar ATPase assembly integral membrane protein VMA21 n=1 Tax=Microthyrium microscopicum TaxID=703497 RepID=A0A6A6UJE8_9PEZI|nr:hypothetical protein BT63DRAFT_452091 [Microthyrium microscopicum]